MYTSQAELAMGLPPRIAALLLFLLAGGEDVLSLRGEKAVVLLFVRTDCPISNRYAPEIERLSQTYSRHGIRFYLVFSESGVTTENLNRHRKEYGYTIPSVVDTGRRYVLLAGVKITPEAAVFVQRRLLYRGRIDDRFVDLGKTRPKPLRHDLEDVLAAVSAGNQLEFRETPPIGCAIEGMQ